MVLSCVNKKYNLNNILGNRMGKINKRRLYWKKIILQKNANDIVPQRHTVKKMVKEYGYV